MKLHPIFGGARGRRFRGIMLAACGVSPVLATAGLALDGTARWAMVTAALGILAMVGALGLKLSFELNERVDTIRERSRAARSDLAESHARLESRLDEVAARITQVAEEFRDDADETKRDLGTTKEVLDRRHKATEKRLDHVYERQAASESAALDRERSTAAELDDIVRTIDEVWASVRRRAQR